MKVIHKITDNTFIEFNESDIKNYSGYGKIGWFGWLMIGILFACFAYAAIKALIIYHL